MVPLGLVAALAAAAVVLRRLPPTPTRTLLPNLLAVAGVLATVAFNLKYSAQEIWVFRDPSTYALTGEWLAHHSSAWIHSQPEVFGTVPGLGDGSLGFAPLGKGVVASQYPDAAPMLVAMGGWISDAMLLRVAPLIGGVALLGFFALARSVVSEWWALGATALLAISLPMINFSRAVYSEPITMVFLLGGLALLFACEERDRRAGWPCTWWPACASGRPSWPGSTGASISSPSPATRSCTWPGRPYGGRRSSRSQHSSPAGRSCSGSESR